jgi:hypothetical protein
MPTATHAIRRQLDAWCQLFDGCTRIADLQPREHATALGVIERLRLVPGESIEAVVSDGTGRLRATWTAREALPGLELGRGLRLEGTVCTDSGTALMRNPTWCLVRDPYACQEEAVSRSGRA